MPIVFGKQQGRKGPAIIINNPEFPEGETKTADGSVTAVMPAGPIERNVSGENSPDIPADQPVDVPENDDPARRRVVNTTPAPKIIRLMRRLLSGRQLSAEEIEERQEMASRKAIEQAMRADAETIASRIVNTLNALNLCYRYPKSQRDMMTGGMTGIQSVRWDVILLSPDAISLQAHMPLPRGVSALNLADTNTITNLSLSVGKQVYPKYNEQIGFWYIVPRSGSLMGIPAYIKYQDMMEKFPSTADKLSIPLGVTLNSRRVYKSLTKMPHMLIAGATGTGKSNFGNAVLATFAQRNTPEDLRMVLVDLKGGMEMSFYEGLPHLLPLEKQGEFENEWLTETGIIDNRNEVPAVLDWMLAEAERRMEMLKRAGYKDIGKYNTRRTKASKKLPRLLLFIDEWADVKLAPKIGNQCEDKLANLAARSRAVGIHIIVCTQTPKKEVIGTLIKTNLPAKVAFSMPSNVASILVLDNGDAKGLAPAGRMIYQNSNEQLTIQTPFMPDETLKKIVAEGIKQKGQVKNINLTGRDITEDEIFAYSLEYMNGSLNTDKLWAHFRERISRNEMHEWLSGMNGQERDVNGTMYRIETLNGRQGGRILVRVDENSI